jgi:mannose-6-phosphate isomerase-like protein (cupin superfamily)
VVRVRIPLAEATSGFLPGSDGGGTTLRFVIDKVSAGAELFGMMVNEIAPGTQDGAGVHTHDNEHGFFILRGRGRFVIGDEEHLAEAGDSVFVRATVPHLVANAGDEPLEYVVIYVPQGPEVELREKYATDNRD